MPPPVCTIRYRRYSLVDAFLTLFMLKVKDRFKYHVNAAANGNEMALAIDTCIEKHEVSNVSIPPSTTNPALPMSPNLKPLSDIQFFNLAVSCQCQTH